MNYPLPTPYKCATCGRKVAYGGGPRNHPPGWAHRVGGPKTSCGLPPVPVTNLPYWEERGEVPWTVEAEERRADRYVGPFSWLRDAPR